MLSNILIHYTRIFNTRSKSIHEKINGRSYLEFALQSEGNRLNTVTRAQRAEHKQNAIQYQ
jgi:hypothetical protein